MECRLHPSFFTRRFWAVGHSRGFSSPEDFRLGTQLRQSQSHSQHSSQAKVSMVVGDCRVTLDISSVHREVAKLQAMANPRSLL
jgi:hypothetical protein